MTALIGVLLALIVGVVPMVVYAMVLWWFDRYEKEPLGLLVATFVWGGGAGRRVLPDRRAGAGRVRLDAGQTGCRQPGRGGGGRAAL